MSEENVQIARGMYESFGKGDIPGVLGQLDPEAEWTEPGGGSSPSGTFKGPDAVGSEVFPPIQENFEEFEVSPEDFDDQGDTVVVKGHFKGKSKSGAELDSAFEHTFEFRDGKVVSLTNKVDDGWAKGWS